MQKLRLILPKDLPASYQLEDLEFVVDFGLEDAEGVDPAPTVVEAGPGRSQVSWVDDRAVISRGVVELEAIVPAGRPAHLGVYDVRGRQVHSQDLAATSESRRLLRWDGRDHSGRSVARGVFYLRLESGRDAAIKRVLMLG